MKNLEFIRVTCPQCKKGYKLESKFAGRTFPCRKDDCKGTVHVPALVTEKSAKSTPPPLPSVARAKSRGDARGPVEGESNAPSRGGIGLVVLLGVGALALVGVSLVGIGGYYLLNRHQPAEVVVNADKASVEQTPIPADPLKKSTDSGKSTIAALPPKKTSEVDKLVGRWRLNVPAEAGDVQALMEFLVDGTCRFDLSIKGQATLSVTGKWKYADGKLSVTMSAEGAKFEDSTIVWKGTDELSVTAANGEAMTLLRENAASNPSSTPTTSGDYGTPVQVIDNPDKLQIHARILTLSERHKAGQFHIGTKPNSPLFQPDGLPDSCKILLIEWTTKDRDTFAADFRGPTLSGDNCHPGSLKGDSKDYPVPALAFDKMAFKEFPIVSVIAGGPGGPVRSGFIQGGGVLKMAWPVPEKCSSVNLELPGRKAVRIELIAGSKAAPKQEAKAEPKQAPKIEPELKMLPPSKLPLLFKSEDGKETLTLHDIRYGTVGKPEARRDKNFNTSYQVTPVTVSDKRLPTSDCLVCVFHITKGFMPTIDGGGKCELLTPQGKRHSFRSLADKEDYKNGFEMPVLTPGWLSIIATQHPTYPNGKPRNILIAFELPPEKATCRLKGLLEFPLVEFTLP